MRLAPSLGEGSTRTPARKRKGRLARAQRRGPGHVPPGWRLPFALWCRLYILLPVKVTEYSSLVPRASLRAQWITCNAGDLGLIPGLGRSSGEGKGCPLQYSDLESSVDCIVHGVAKSWTRLSNFHLHSCAMQSNVP